jgi:hypothetical protein
LAEQAVEATILANRSLALDEETETVLEGEALNIGHSLLFFEGIGHTCETEFAELAKGLFN